MGRFATLASYEDFRRKARRRLPRILFDYIDGGSYAEATLEDNVRAFSRHTLTQRVMIDVSEVNSEITLFGERLSAPIILAPVGFSGMYARRGEVQAARAARAAGLPFCLSTVGICSVDEVARDSGGAPWFQLYVIKDRDWMARMLERAQDAGSRVLVLTADLQTPGVRYRDIRSAAMSGGGLSGRLRQAAEGLGILPWIWDVMVHGRPHQFGNLDDVLPKGASFADAWAWIAANFDPSVNWDDLDFIRRHWNGPIVLKGVMTREDAMLACNHGLDGVVVSNHGGRQLDGAPASIDALPAVVDAVAGRLPVFLDSGVRSGLDVLKALKLGATACLIGRPWAMALAAGGQDAVARMLDVMKSELTTAQILSATHRLQARDAVQSAPLVEA